MQYSFHQNKFVVKVPAATITKFVFPFLFLPCLYMHGGIFFTGLNVIKTYHFQVQDSFPFSIGFSSDRGPICTESNATLFCKGQPFPSLKILTFNRTNDFHLEAFYVDQHGLPSGVSPQISSCMVCFCSYMLLFLDMCRSCKCIS